MFATMTPLFGGFLLTAMLLGFCWYVLVRACRRDDADAELNELLVHEILTDAPSLALDGSPLMLSHAETGDRQEGD